jgi:hypothetical protein
MARTSRVDHLSDSRRQLETLLEGGIVAGVASAFVTAALLALAGVLAGVGAVVPFYAIVSVVDPGALDLARDELDQGVAVTFLQRPFVGGLGICLVLGAVSGLVFALGVRRHRLPPRVALLVGAVHGVLMMCLFYLGALRLVSLALGFEADAMSLAQLVGWPALAAVHAVHGVVVAVVIRSRLGRGGNVFAAAAGPPPAH